MAENDIFAVSSDVEESINASKTENENEYLARLQLSYAISGVCKDSVVRFNKAREANPNNPELWPELFEEGMAFFFKGKDDDELAVGEKVELPVKAVLIQIQAIAEAWAKKKDGDGKEVVKYQYLEYSPEVPVFSNRVEWAAFQEKWVPKYGDRMVKLSHRTLVYLPDLDKFAYIYFKHTTTSDYAQLVSASTGLMVFNIGVYTQFMKKTKSNWHRWTSKATAISANDYDITGIAEARELFKPAIDDEEPEVGVVELPEGDLPY